MGSYKVYNCDWCNAKVSDYTKIYRMQTRTEHSLSSYSLEIEADTVEICEKCIDKIKEISGKKKNVIEEYFENLDILAERGINKELLQHLKVAGPVFGKTVKMLVDASDECVEVINSAFENECALLRNLHKIKPYEI